MSQRIAIFLSALLLVSGTMVPAFAQEDPYAALHTQDRRLAVVADRLLVANRTLCRQTMPVTGLLLQSADQYGSAPDGWFEQAPVVFADVLPGSAGAQAGIAQWDGLIAIAGTRLASLPAEDGKPRRDTVFDRLAAEPDADGVTLTIRHEGTERQVHLDAPTGCRALVEILTDNDDTARSDGRVVQLSFGIASRLNDDELAVIFAHELAHVVLEHRRRLEAAGVSSGILGEFGRNQRLRRQVEVNADLLSAHLLANAGYDPMIAPQFWRSRTGREISHGIFRSRAYPSSGERAQQIENEIRNYLAGVVLPSVPEHLLGLIDQPFPD